MSTPSADLAALLALVTSGADPHDAAAWLETAARCTACLTRPGQGEPAPAPAVSASMDPEDIEALSQGRMRGPVTASGPEGDVIVCAVGHPQAKPASRALLWAWRTDPWDEEHQALALHAADAATALLRAQDISVREQALEGALMAARVSAFQALMAGDLVRAGRALAPMLPDLVPAGAGQVAIVEVPAERCRTAMTRDIDRLCRARVLTVRYPVDDRQVIVLRPVGGPELPEVLRPLVSAGCTVGISPVTPWQRTTMAYREAVEALAAARGMAARLAVHDGRPPLVEMLGTDARVWAALVLQPVEETYSVAEREELYALAREVLWWGETPAAQLVGWHRHTLARRMDRLSALTGHDRSRLWTECALWLAMQLATQPRPPLLPGIVTLPQALDSSGAWRWARQVVDPMPLPVRDAVAAWLDSRCQPGPAAARLGVSRTTLYRRLERAQTATRLEITRCPGAGCEMALAMYIAGEVEMGTLPDLSDRHLTAQGGDIVLPDPQIDTSRPHPARVYDYLVGGKTHFAADRAQAARMQVLDPHAITVALTNRAWMLRAARALPELGVDQVLDLGSGIPTSPNLHEELLAVSPDARVVYVDSDPIVLAHAHELIRGSAPGQLAYAQADVTEGAETLLSRPEVCETLDLSRPVALFVSALLHFMPGPPGPELVHGVMSRLAPGSVLAISHLTADHAPGKVLPGVERYASTVAPLCVRSYQEMADILAGMTVVDPGIVSPAEWRPEPGATNPPREHINMWAAVAVTS